MSEESIKSEGVAMQKAGDDPGGRQRSTIAFPYADLKSAIEIAEAIHGNVGLGNCADDQLAAWTRQSPKSSGFRVQLSAARLFGVIETESGSHKLSEIGAAIIDPTKAREAKARAFLNVPLYRRVFEKYKGGVLPNQSAALENEMVSLGVSPKIKDRARQTFERSAEQAGFFEHGKTRLVQPAVQLKGRNLQDDTKPVEDSGSKSVSAGGTSDTNPSLDPIIAGLLKRLPGSGSVWPVAERKLWLQLLEGSFQLIYKDTHETAS